MTDSLYAHEVTFIDARSQEVRHQAMAVGNLLELLPLDVITCRLIGMKCLLRSCFLHYLAGVLSRENILQRLLKLSAIDMGRDSD